MADFAFLSFFFFFFPPVLSSGERFQKSPTDVYSDTQADDDGLYRTMVLLNTTSTSEKPYRVMKWLAQINLNLEYD